MLQDPKADEKYEVGHAINSKYEVEGGRVSLYLSRLLYTRSSL